MIGATPRNRAIDGLRALSISLVLLSHAYGTRGSFIPYIAGRYGEFGVRVFFVISGYLITSLLLTEITRYGGISLRRFYFRRCLRLYPAFLVFVLFVAFLDRVGLVQLRDGDLIHAFTYTVNYHWNRSWWLGHLWSLSIEEQFYFTWPIILKVGGRRFGLILSLAIIVLAPVLRLAVFILSPQNSKHIDEITFTVADQIACGCLLAFVQSKLHGEPLYRRIQNSTPFLFIPFLTLALNLDPVVRVQWMLGESLMNLGITLCLDACLFKTSLVSRLLNSPRIAFVGLLSYSLYLWQQLFLNRESAFWLATFPINIVCALGAAWISYRWIETPFLAVRPAWELRLFGPRGRLQSQTQQVTVT